MAVKKSRLSKETISETVSSRIKNPKLVRKKHLLIAKKAAKLFREKGYHRTTMREISSATGMAMGNLYNYISKKEDVLCLVFDVYHDYVEEYLEKKDPGDSEDTKEQLRSFVRNSLQNVQNFSDLILLMYRESRLLPKENMDRAMQKELGQIQALEIIIRKGVDQGVFPPMDPFFAASMIFYQSIFLTLRGWTLKGKYTDEEVNALIEDYILRPFIA
jgi:AcrR family transcriptional regulator